MRDALIFLGGAALGAGIGCLAWVRATRALRRRLRELKRGAEKQKMETSKKVMWICLAMGFLWVWCSYVLAWMDRTQIAESLSATAVTEIIGVVLAYSIKSAVENLSKNNAWPDKSARAASGTEPEQEGEEPAG